MNMLPVLGMLDLNTLFSNSNEWKYLQIIKKQLLFLFLMVVVLQQAKINTLAWSPSYGYRIKWQVGSNLDRTG